MPEWYGRADGRTDGWMDEWLSVMVTPGESLTYRTGGCLAIVLNVAVAVAVAVSVTIDAAPYPCTSRALYLAEVLTTCRRSKCACLHA